MGPVSDPKLRIPRFKWLAIIVGSLSLVVICHLLLVVATATAQYDPPIVVINELQYHPLSDDHGEEYVELYNTSTITADVSGWSFSDGIRYTFPPSTTIPPGGYLVVGHDPTTVETVYGITGVLGPFESGRLANEGERVAIDDAGGRLVDEVTYDDHPPWPELPDGKGPSLELINPAFDNDRPCSWAASQPVETGLGTPGVQNSVYSTDNVPPCVTGVTHTPAFPTSDQTVTVTAFVNDNSLVATVTLHYHLELVSDYITLPMNLSSPSPQGGTGGVYTAVIPPHEDGLYVEFYVTATDDQGAERTVPEGAPGGTSDETRLPVTISYLYQIEDNPPSSTLPIYRLIMTRENQAELVTRDIFSNDLLDATFVHGEEVFYNVGVRYRGETTRNFDPRPYRIKFRDEHEFNERERINLVSDELGREAMAHDLFRRAGLPAPDTRFVTLFVNEERQGDYLDIEQVDNEFVRAHFPDDDGGNLYRGVDRADLSYRGSDPDAYRPYYVKKNNYDADDYSDVIALTDALTNSPDETFRAEAEAVADMWQWLRWFALQAILDNHEGALWAGSGDDYFLYHCPSDDRFVLISWDHDTLFLFPNHSVWEPNWYAPQIVQRILNYPYFTRWYYQHIASIAANEFSVAEMYPRIDALPAVVSEGDRDELKQYVAARIPALNSQIPQTRLSITTNGGQNFLTKQTEVTLEGECSPLRDVYVNGEGGTLHVPLRVQYPTATTWRYTSTLPRRDNVFVITDGLDSRTITVYRDIFHGGTLTEDTTIPTSGYPYVISENIVVPEGITLTIEPGVTLQFEGERFLRVEGGRLLAEGTAAQPIVLTRRDSGYWGGVLFHRSRADNRIGHAVIEYTHEVISNPRTHGVSAYNSRVTIADSILRHTRGSDHGCNAVIADWNSTLYLLRNEIYQIEGDGVHATGGYAFIQGNHIHDVQHPVWPVEGIELSDMVTPAIVLDNHVHHVSDDCMDLNHSSALNERNELHHCGDKGISIGHPSSTTLVNNLIYTCVGKDEDPFSGTGIAVKDSAVSRIVNNTVSDSRYGIYLYEGHTGHGGGKATVVNSIVWDNGVDLALDALSTVTVTYSTLAFGAGTVWPGEGNLFADPLFRDPQNGNYRLQEDSPCVDAGTEVGAPDVDIRGVYRPHGEGYDQGAHEFFEFFSCYLPLVLRSH